MSGWPEVVLTSTRREAEIGSELAKDVERTMGLAGSPCLTRYVEAVGQRLAAHSPRRDVTYHFYVVDVLEPNAFALPGGYVYVSSGLLAIANSEDELAAVLSHEITHVAARHAVQRQTRALPIAVLSAVVSLPGAILGDPLTQAVGRLPQAAGALLLASYSRDQEHEADRVGQQVAAESGWDPAALAGFLRSVERQVELETGERRRPSFFDSHPSTPDREKQALRRAKTLERAPPNPIAGTRRAFLDRLEGLRVGPDPAEGVFRAELFLHPDLDFALRFPRQWKTHNAQHAVAAIAPDGDALLLLEAQGRGDDLGAAARAFSNATELTLTEPTPVKIAGLPAVRALSAVRTRKGPLILDLTFIAHGGTILRITGVSPVGRYEEHYGELFRDSVRTYRPLRPEERTGFTALRLRVASARAGETLEALSRRTGNVWSVEQTAVANALAPDAHLDGGQLLKIAREEPYRPSQQ